MASCAVASIAWAISRDNPDALTLVMAALRRGYDGGEEAEVMEVPVCEGNGDDRWGDEDEFVVPLVWGLSPAPPGDGRPNSSCRRRRLIASNSSHMAPDETLPAGGDVGDISFRLDT